MYDDLVKRLRELHPEEFGDKWDFAFACQQAMCEAADAIENLDYIAQKYAETVYELEYKYKKAIGDLVKQAEPLKEKT